jgi:hypothetical protein
MVVGKAATGVAPDVSRQRYYAGRPEASPSPVPALTARMGWERHQAPAPRLGRKDLVAVVTYRYG